ncbi:hypothetical protein DYY67_0689 [Candidatus Nitrosotalea sp. TS]|uniref:hypothetical protein n=1 Tax=Candidatus Nitrosotalea sp. TS TaxID=2341020 RepID=UPI001ED3B851|nr:hypothetical protein [Candidatus Nitrosotalea sp. TS]NHI02650.1 hypothetical protein [Candidatus Nitrosotalea sp. TS]
MRIFYTQKLESLLEKIELTDWRQRLREPLTCNEQSLSDNWKFCALGERMRREGRDIDKVKDLTPEAIKLGFSFATAVKRRDSTMHLKSWSKLKNCHRYGTTLVAPFLHDFCTIYFLKFLATWVIV